MCVCVYFKFNYFDKIPKKKDQNLVYLNDQFHCKQMCTLFCGLKYLEIMRNTRLNFPSQWDNLEETKEDLNEYKYLNTRLVFGESCSCKNERCGD